MTAGRVAELEPAEGARRIERTLGQIAMVEVYLARDSRWKRQVALGRNRSDMTVDDARRAAVAAKHASRGISRRWFRRSVRRVTGFRLDDFP